MVYYRITCNWLVLHLGTPVSLLICSCATCTSWHDQSSPTKREIARLHSSRSEKPNAGFESFPGKLQCCIGAYKEPNVVGDSKADQCRDCASWSCTSARRQRTSGQFTRVPNCVFQSYASQRTLLQSWGMISTELQNVETILTVWISSISPYKQTLGDRPWSESVAWGSSEANLRPHSGGLCNLLEGAVEKPSICGGWELSWGGDYWRFSVTSESHLDLQMLQRPSPSSSSSSSSSA